MIGAFFCSHKYYTCLYKLLRYCRWQYAFAASAIRFANTPSQSRYQQS